MSDEKKVAIAKAVKELRKSFGLSQVKFAVAHDFDPSHYPKWEQTKSDRFPNTANMIKLGNLSLTRDLALFFWDAAGLNPARALEVFGGLTKAERKRLLDRSFKIGGEVEQGRPRRKARKGKRKA